LIYQNLKAKIRNVDICPFLMNASGPLCTTREELLGLVKSSAGAIVTKSATVLPREGNPEPRLYECIDYTVQAMGLPNPGYAVYVQMATELKGYGKPLVGSVAGFDSEEYLTMARAYERAGFDIIEVNLSCPNVKARQLCYNPKAAKEVLRGLTEIIRVPLTVKVGPYFDCGLMEEMISVFEDSGVDAIVAVNSPAGATVIREGHFVLKPKYGGLSGKALKPLALGNVAKFHELTDIPIIGVGGIGSANDVKEYLAAGAIAVQIGTAYMQEGPGIFARLADELV
jgi:dihydroorotate dehydrogenase (fumarate)